MKNAIYALILPVVVAGGLVFANCQSQHTKPKKPDANEKAEAAMAVFKSTDGGQSWQDISQGLPENVREAGVRGDSIFANNRGLFLRVGNSLYHSTPAATAPFWTKKVFAYEPSTAPSKAGISAPYYWSVNLQTTNGESVWSPVFDNGSEPRIRSVFETASGAIFIGTDKGLFKTDNRGKTWKHVYASGWAGHLAEGDGVLVSTSKRSLIRSTDGGESWAPAMSEDRVAFDVKPIKGGFAAITSNAEANTPNTSRLSTSYDGGRTWQVMDASLQDKGLIDSVRRTWDDRPRIEAFATAVTQVGEAFFCTHPDGVFKSSDKGNTWKLLLPSVEGKVFSLFVSGNVIYAIRSKGGC